jgi:hypothetical protein
MPSPSRSSMPTTPTARRTRQRSAPKLIQLPEDVSHWLQGHQEFNLSEFVREEWKRWTIEKRKDWPMGQHRGRLPAGAHRQVRIVTTVALDPAIVHQIERLRERHHAFNMSAWVEKVLREKVGLVAANG